MQVVARRVANLETLGATLRKGTGDMEFLLVVIGLVVMGFVGWHLLTANANARNQAREDLIARFRRHLDEAGIGDPLIFGSFYGTNALAYTEPENLFFVASRAASGAVDFEKLEPEKILKFEFEVNGNTVSSFSTGEVAARSFAGGVLFGQTGAMIGGLTAKQKSEQIANRLALRLVVDDISKPRRDFIFYESNQTRSLDDALLMAEVLTGGNPEEWAHRILIATQRAKN